MANPHRRNHRQRRRRCKPFWTGSTPNTHPCNTSTKETARSWANRTFGSDTTPCWCSSSRNKNSGRAATGTAGTTTNTNTKGTTATTTTTETATTETTTTTTATTMPPIHNPIEIHDRHNRHNSNNRHNNNNNNNTGVPPHRQQHRRALRGTAAASGGCMPPKRRGRGSPGRSRTTTDLRITIITDTRSDRAPPAASGAASGAVRQTRAIATALAAAKRTQTTNPLGPCRGC
mmetsp:Transcript_12826/g.27021  ORF Transcript_12826/g.27021 Transcript_12826/m.27021 type:complete len:232 (-) Transcript_12826:670-1365(-)